MVVVISKQLLDQEDVDVVHPLDKEKGLTLEEFKLIKIHMSNREISLFLPPFFLFSSVCSQWKKKLMAVGWSICLKLQSKCFFDNHKNNVK